MTTLVKFYGLLLQFGDNIQNLLSQVNKGKK